MTAAGAAYLGEELPAVCAAAAKGWRAWHRGELHEGTGAATHGCRKKPRSVPRACKGHLAACKVLGGEYARNMEGPGALLLGCRIFLELAREHHFMELLHGEA